MRHYSPKEYQAASQVFAATQDRRGVLFFALPAGQLIAYDGATWETVDVAFSPLTLAVDSDGTVLIAGSGDLGHVEVDQLGMRFISLAPELPEVAQGQLIIPEIESAWGKAFFMERRHLLIWDGEHFEAWAAGAGTTFQAMTLSADEIFMWEEGLGASVWDPETGEGQPFGPRSAIKVYDILIGFDNDLLVSTTDGRIIRVTVDGVADFSPTATEIIAGQGVYDLKRMGDDRLLVGTLGAGLLILDQDGQIIAHYDSEAIPTGTVYEVLTDRQGHHWLASAKGIIRLSGSPLSWFGPQSGLPQTVLKMTRFRGLLYAATFGGTYRMVTTGWAPARFEHLPELPGQIWDLLDIGPTLLVSTSNGVLAMTDGEVVTVDHERTAGPLGWYGADQKLLVGHESSVKLLQRQDSSWIELDRWPTQESQVLTITEGEPGTFWIHTGPSATCLYRVTIRADNGAPDWRAFSSDSPWYRVIEMGDGVRFIREDGVYRFQPDTGEMQRDTRFDTPWLLERVRLHYLIAVRSDQHGRTWLVTSLGIDEIEEGPDRRFVRSQPPVHLPEPLYPYTYLDSKEEALWLVSGEGLLRYDTGAERSAAFSFYPLIHLRLQKESEVLGSSHEEIDLTALPHGLDPLRFDYALPYFVNESLTEYQQQMVGFDREWSEWSAETHREYTNLPGREYRFEVRARYAGEQIGEVSSYSFRVRPPWYRQWWANLLWAALVVAAFIGFARLRSWKIEQERRVLARKVEERTIELEKGRRQLEAQAEELKQVNLQLEEEMQATHEAVQARIAMESKMHESQRLESLGVLAGGIAHDFNNILAIVMGSAELAKLNFNNTSGITNNLDQIIGASERAAELCTQMLAYAGKAPFDCESLDVNQVVREMYSLLKTSVAHARLDLELTPGIKPIEADRNQVEQVILNLVMNAKESSDPSPSWIRVATGESQPSSTYLRDHTRGSATNGGRYVTIEVSDDGEGIEPEVLDKIFEPFFTTKFFGRGLGLAAVFGILRLHDAAIEVDSERGQGSSFRALFPAQPEEIQIEKPAETVSVPIAAPAVDSSVVSGGCILVVDDEEGIRELAREAMGIVGFEVRTAENGRQGLSLLESSGGKDVQCVLLDMTMPEMDGATTFVAIREIYPKLPTVIMSGYNESHVLQQFPADRRPQFLHKPFTIEHLKHAVLQAISESAAAGRSGS
jgi:signal transduction histidine kinase/CheY-like chemotaxis protein/ligand-binding sensor domain-containing protein